MGNSLTNEGKSGKDEMVLNKGSGLFGKGRRFRHGRGGCGASDVPNLNDAVQGKALRINRLRGRGPIRQRLLDMGFVPGAEVVVVRSAPLFDPIEVRVGDSFITVRREEAAHIEVVDA